MNWLAGIVLLLVLPWVEFWLMMGTGVSLVPAVALSVATAGVGWWFARREKLDLWSELESDVRNGRVPTMEGLDAMMVVAAGWALIVPGLVTDLLGAIFLVPAIRRIVMEPLRQGIRRWML